MRIHWYIKKGEKEHLEFPTTGQVPNKGDLIFIRDFTKPEGLERLKVKVVEICHRLALNEYSAEHINFPPNVKDTTSRYAYGFDEVAEKTGGTPILLNMYKKVFVYSLHEVEVEAEVVE